MSGWVPSGELPDPVADLVRRVRFTRPFPEQPSWTYFDDIAFGRTVLGVSEKALGEAYQDAVDAMIRMRIDAWARSLLDGYEGGGRA